MKRIGLFLLMLILIPCLAFAVDVKLDWDASPGATGYKIQMSTDQGVTWLAAVDAKLVKPYTYLNVPEDRRILFRVAAYNTVSEAWNTWAGCWYDHRMKLLNPVGVRAE